ncbi:MAG TPA: pitrilysin family protein [Rhodospirillales bacterium]|nr:pitrilysin family protein [Rhodospirillales bacterium]
MRNKLRHRWAKAIREVIAVVAFVAPLLATAFSAAAIEVARVVSPGDIEAWLVEEHTNPIITMRIAFEVGAAADPVGKEGLANMASSLLDEGAGELDSQAFQRRLEDLSITLRFDAGRDTFNGQLKTLTENKNQAFDLLGMALKKPRFDAEPVLRIRSQIMARLRRLSQDPGTVANRRLLEILFPDHPYGRPPEGTLASVGAVTAGDIKEFVDKRLAVDNLVIGVVGDITAAELAPLLDATFGGLPAAAETMQVPEVRAKAKGQTMVVDIAVPQSAIVFGHQGIKRDDPHFYAAYVMNYILGGGNQSSRLYQEVREKRGLAYSVHSLLYPLDHSALIVGGAGTANARVGETLEVLRREWRRLAEAGVSGEELTDAKTYLTGSFPLRFTSSSRIASFLVGVQLDDLGIDYLDKRNGYIEAVTLPQVNRLARWLLDAEALSVVVAGAPDGIGKTEKE